MSATLFIISAPSGAGKTSLVSRCLQDNQGICVSVSHTTRPARPGEVDGKDYHFVDKDSFQNLLKAGDFLESAEVFGNNYGTSKSAVNQQLEAGTDVILEIDWQGAQQVRKQFAEHISIFILPPSLKVLEDRLTNRGQDDRSVIENRLAQAHAEISHYAEFDYLIVNDVFDDAAEELNSIIRSARLKFAKQSQKHETLLSELLNK